MTLDEYISTTGRSASELAADLGISRSYLSEIRHCKATPSLKLAFAIERATDGLVSAKGLNALHSLSGDNNDQALAADDADVNGNLSADFPVAVQS